MKLETLAIHAGRAPDPATGAVREPIHLSTTFERDADGSFRRGYEYTRSGNPNRATLERAVAALEGGREAVAFASGSAATLAVFTLAASFFFHNYWGMPAEQQFMQQLLFMKNVGVTGGLLALAAFGAGAFSVDGRRAA